MGKSHKDGPLRTLSQAPRYCSRSPHCRHSLHEQNLEPLELTDCGTDLLFAALPHPRCATAAIAYAELLANFGRFCAALLVASPNRKLNIVK